MLTDVASADSARQKKENIRSRHVVSHRLDEADTDTSKGRSVLISGSGLSFSDIPQDKSQLLLVILFLWSI